MKRAAVATVDAIGAVLRTADLLTELRDGSSAALLGVSQDSREVRPGDLFLAWKGGRSDAHDFVPEAIRKGAVAVLVERPLDVDVPQLVVTDGRRAGALAAHAVMGDPSERLRCLGVTGTNGKTTTTMLIRHLLAPRIRTAVIGTLGLVDDGGVRPGSEGLTTPGPVRVAVWLRELADGGVEAVVFEASSHALEQHRLDGVRFDVVVFTNLSQDHLDYHGDLASYREAKARLVELADADGTVVINRGEPAWDDLDLGGRRCVTYAVGAEADFRADDLATDASGTTFTLTVEDESHRVRLPLVGRYNVENALAAGAASHAAGVPLDEIVEGLAAAPQVSGRLEAVTTSPFTVLIDFAHTPDALANAVSAVAAVTPGRVIVVFGAGGDRDPSKRRPMAEATARSADLIVLTSDNPRSEDPERILDDLEEGLRGVQHLRLVDRRQAIEAALAAARPGDTVLLAGKGHERYQIVGDRRIPFDERSIVTEYFERAGAA